MADITLGQFYNAMAQAAREGTLQVLAQKDFATDASIQAVKTILEALAGIHFASEDTLEDILQKLPANPATADNQATIKAVLDLLNDKIATETTLAAVKAALDAISGKIATEASLAQAVQKLTALLERLDQKLTVEGEVQLKGSSTPIPARTDLETIINAKSVAPGSSATANVSVNGESEIWALVSIDRQPWTLMAGTAWYPSSEWGIRSWYPERSGRTTTPSIINPEISLYMPLSPAAPYLGLTAPQTLAEARQYLIPPRSFILAVRNGSGDVATVTVRLLRVWR